MGILSSSVSLCQFRVVGTTPETALFENISTQLRKFAFKPIEDSTDELSVGWVHLDDNNETSFEVAQEFFRDHFVTMTLRKDQRRVPSVLLNSNLKKAETEYLKANPAQQRVPKQEKADLAETVKAVLCSKTLPSPSTYDVVWDTNSNTLSFASISSNIIDLFINLFTDTFEDLTLELVLPITKAEMVVIDSLRESLLKNKNTDGGDIVAQIEDSLWLGWEFLLWLMFQSMKGSSIYHVNQDGVIKNGEEFIAFIDEKLLLIGSDDRGIQKVTVAGPQSNFLEVTTALKEKKQITEATILFELKEDSWKLTLKGDRFSFAGFKTPSVKLEKDGVVDMGSEKEALFYEKMVLLEKGVQLFDSLFSTFLTTRLNGSWSEEEKNIQNWFEGADKN